MKKFHLLLLALVFPAWLLAQPPTADANGNFTPEQLDQIVAPIALYPDPLIALILPAAASPGDIVLAERYIEANGPNPTDSQPWVDSQSWDDSVKALVHYPDVIKWMSDNLDWTTALGHAFALQPTDVMESIQQMRAEARANGTLVSTPQQTVEMEGSTICVFPAQPDVICIPQYDPAVVFVDEPIIYTTPIIFFGPPCRVGPWLRFRCDWDDFGVWIGTWQPGRWTYVREWRQPRGQVPGRGFWRPDPVRQRAVLRPSRPIATLPRPRPMANAPTVASRAASGNRVPAGGASRPDPRGWRVDANGHLAATPAPAAPRGGAQVITGRPPEPAPWSTTPPAERPQDLPGNRSPASPVERGPVSVNRPPVPPVNRPAPVVAPPVSHPAPIMVPTAPTPGPAFGAYDRGTQTRNESDRGQASRAFATPPPRVAPEPHSAPAPQPREMPASPPAVRMAPSAPPPASNGEGSDPRNRR